MLRHAVMYSRLWVKYIYVCMRCYPCSFLYYYFLTRSPAPRKHVGIQIAVDLSYVPCIRVLRWLNNLARTTRCRYTHDNSFEMTNDIAPGRKKINRNWHKIINGSIIFLESLKKIVQVENVLFEGKNCTKTIQL